MSITAFRRESDFRKTLCSVLEQASWFTQKIEAEGMNVGIPDMFICKGDYTFFLELKNENKSHIHYALDKVKVHWRPGQQAWAKRYFNATSIPVYTVIAYLNGYAIIPTGREVFYGNIVPISNITILGCIQDVVDYFNERR